MKRIITTIALSCVIVLHLDGCARTIAPKSNVPTQASYSGSKKTSGILRVSPGGGRVVDNHYKARYNELISLYGDQFEPDLKTDAGIIPTEKPDEWIIDLEHHVKMGQMLQWKRNGREPTGMLKKLIDKVL